MGSPSVGNVTGNAIIGASLFAPADPKEIRYAPLDYLIAHPNPENPKDHDIGDIMASIIRHGFVGYVTFDPSIEMMVAGHGRLETLAAMRDDGHDAPERIEVIDGAWCVPTYFKIFANDWERNAYTVGDNQTTIKGGWLMGDLTNMLERAHKRDPEHGLDGTGFDEGDLQAMLADKNYEPPPPPPPPQIQTRYGVLVQVMDRDQEDIVANLLISHGWEKFLRLSEDE